ncbi:hypothetical protein [uncultured Pseudokineococcus sp.]|uniref:hypothetical protein n=1 Tax=uncultured Pseudokineococcus sp. TaxID=1642928 RepID=UPI00262D472F|nr:hypothetical protein [uncultured Pseudokineococcus sp.]
MTPLVEDAELLADLRPYGAGVVDRLCDVPVVVPARDEVLRPAATERTAPRWQHVDAVEHDEALPPGDVTASRGHHARRAGLRAPSTTGLPDAGAPGPTLDR